MMEDGTKICGLKLERLSNTPPSQAVSVSQSGIQQLRVSISQTENLGLNKNLRLILKSSGA